MATVAPPLSYARYLRLPRLLSCQERESQAQGRPAHDEMLFIVAHQSYELWFKQILFELDGLQATLAKPEVAEREVGGIVRGLTRIAAILRVLVRQLDVLETMTPLDFLEFRDLLVPASGFQSVQFRLIEARLGLRGRLRPEALAASLADDERAALVAAEATPSLAEQIQAWLERTPFLDIGGYRFHTVYRDAVAHMLDRDFTRASSTSADATQMTALAQARDRFQMLLDDARHAEGVAQGWWHWSRLALLAALFIVLYRDEPILQSPFRVLDQLMDIDETLANWRHRHALTVERMIGMKLGTGGSSGHRYLRDTVGAHRVFSDLFALSTFLIPRSALPPLPEELRRRMDFARGAAPAP